MLLYKEAERKVLHAFSQLYLYLTP